MLMIPRTLKVIRHIYVLLISYFLMNAAIFLGLLLNIYGFSGTKPDPSKYATGVNALELAFLLILVTTAIYLVIEFSFKIYLKNNKQPPVPAQPAKYSMVLAYFYLIVYAYMFKMSTFSLVGLDNDILHFVSTIILNIISIFVIIKLFISKNYNGKMERKTWVIMILLSIFLFIFYMSKPFRMFRDFLGIKGV